MPRIVKSVDNIIVVPAGALPAAGTPYWYSDRGAWTADPDGNPVTESGGVGGTIAEGEGFVSQGNHTDLYLLFLEIVAWDGVTSIELQPEITRHDSGTDFGPVPNYLSDEDNVHLDVKPKKYLISKTDYPNDTTIVPLELDLICSRVRFGVRAAAGSVGGAEAVKLHCQLARRVD